MIGKEKLHVGAPKPVFASQGTIKPISRTNQAPGKVFLSRFRHPASSNNAWNIGNPMGRIIAFLYGIASYVVFFVAFLYAIGFVSGLAVPKTIDTGTVVPLAEAFIVNLLLMSVFAIQHSVMARKQFKQWWTLFVPKSVERSTYVLFSSLALILLFWQWRPIPTVVWHIDNPQIAMAGIALSFAGWLIVLTSTFLINHFELFGLHQVASNLAGRSMPAPRFRTPLYYKFVRHPIYLGFIIAFWAAPTMTAGHLLFAAVTTAYIVVGILLEERDLVDLFGDDYRRYKDRVSMLVPWRKSA
jgi:protein-S-isoprenylcysteine O-methyltransferase Ste14